MTDTAPGAVSLSGSDSILLDDRILTDLADQDPVIIELPDDLAKVKASKNGNTIYAINEMGRLAKATIRLLLGGADDRYMNARLQEQRNDFSAFILLTGQFSKRVGDGKGKVRSVIYQCSGGVIERIPTAKTSAEGDAAQSVAEYVITFGNATRSIQ